MKRQTKTFFLLIFSFLWINYPLTIYAQSPLQNRARGYCDKNNFKLAINNFGRFAGVDPPYGLWKDFQYISNFSFILGIPGKDQNGTLYPWAVGKKQIFDPGTGQFSIAGDDSTYWGPTVSESWSDNSTGLKYTDWEAVSDLNNPQCTVGKYYGDGGYFTFTVDSTPLIATSTIPQSWPLHGTQPFWPGHWAIDFNDPAGKEELRNIFVSDQDFYFAFDDRYATRDALPQQGYPTSVRVDVSCHVFNDSLAKDILFFDLQMHNQSPYDYQNVFVGLYLDADMYHALADGRFSGRSNDDDAVGFEPDLNLAYFYDLDGDSLNPYVAGKKLAWLGLQLLKMPPASQNLDLDGDGLLDIAVGEPLKVTGFHWFNWKFRPGITYYVPPEGPIQILDATNKEEIQYKILAGDTTNLRPDEARHFFHAETLNGHKKLNPYFDSVDALFKEYPDGTDCVVILSTGPFALPSDGRESFSFCLIMAESESDLIRKAEFALQAASSNFKTIPAVQQRVLAALANYRLEQNFPNPFNSQTRVVFTMPESEKVTLEIFDIQGRKVATYLNKPLRKGQHTVVIKARNWASGLYFYRLIVGQRIIASKKMLLVR